MLRFVIVFFGIIFCYGQFLCPVEHVVAQETRNQKVTPEQLKSIGIDPNNPAQAAERARQLGVPEADIQKALGQAASSVPPSESVPATQEVQPTEEPVSAGESDLSAETAEKAQEQPTEVGSIMGKGRFSGLSYYGYDIFLAAKGSVGPIEIGPVDPGYPIGAGDVIRLTMWGEVEFQNELTVDRNGNVVIPKAGQVFVAGTRLDNLRESLKNYLSRFYSGLAQEPPTIFMDVTIARLRSNQIYIMGEVERPGAYAISSYATAFNAMYAIGGPQISGSLRDVRILREGKIVSRVDLYDYLLKGTSTDDKRLQINDIVFVPPRKLTVGIKGEVLRPSIYELTENESLVDLVNLAGGLNPAAYGFRAQIDRILPLEKRIKGQVERELIDIDIEAVMGKRITVRLEDGDIVQIFPILDSLFNYVDVVGNGILRPGRYELNEKIRTISDLVIAADGLTADGYAPRADLVRTKDDLTTEFIEINLEQALLENSVYNIELKRWDVLKIYSTLELIGIPQVTLGGYVKSPGRYPLHENMTVYDLIFAYSGLQDSLRFTRTFMERSDIFRLNKDGKTRRIVSFNLKDVWEKKHDTDMLLEQEDNVVLYNKDVYELLTQKVTISGAVKKPGDYDLEKNLTLADLLVKCGGFSEGAFIVEAEVSRIPHSGIPGDSLAYILTAPILEKNSIPEDVEEAVRIMMAEDSPAKQFQLEPNDHVFIRFNPDYNPAQTITITGEVMFPGVYVLNKKNEMLSDIITRAGGLRKTAYAGGGQFYRKDVQLFVNFEALLVKNEKKNDVVLLPGDRIVMPPYPNTVLLTGEVMNPGLYKYVKGTRISDYFEMSGGKTDNGGRVYYTFQSGETHRLKFLQNSKVRDGTVIRVLPKKVKEKKAETDWGEVVKETTAILSSAMMVIYLSQQIK